MRSVTVSNGIDAVFYRVSWIRKSQVCIGLWNWNSSVFHVVPDIVYVQYKYCCLIELKKSLKLNILFLKYFGGKETPKPLAKQNLEANIYSRQVSCFISFCLFLQEVSLAKKTQTTNPYPIINLQWIWTRPLRSQCTMREHSQESRSFGFLSKDLLWTCLCKPSGADLWGSNTVLSGIPGGGIELEWDGMAHWMEFSVCVASHTSGWGLPSYCFIKTSV